MVSIQWETNKKALRNRENMLFRGYSYVYQIQIHTYHNFNKQIKQHFIETTRY